jgi:sigma-70-like protein
MANTQMGAVLQYVRQLGAAPNTTGPIDQQLLQDFSLRRDEAAFTALVQRHGSLVLGVCRSVLGCLEDAEDAFQSTFMVLARKAASIRKGVSLACWLHGVAYRMALQAQSSESGPGPASSPLKRSPGRYGISIAGSGLTEGVLRSCC